MRAELKNLGFDQIPQLTSSRMIEVNETMYIVPEVSTGKRRALLIGINYVGQEGKAHIVLVNISLFHAAKQSAH